MFDHVNMRKTERHQTGFNNTKMTGLFAKKAQDANAKILTRQRERESQTQTIDGVPVGDIVPVTVKTANKTIRHLKQEAA